MSLDDHVCKINTLTGEITFNGNIIVLRPKTFQLFLLLASAPESIFSKAEILASVWAGSIVEDQVIFQSINEIRKELGDSDVIKTYPRRGYCIGVSILIVTSSKEKKSKNTGQTKIKYRKKWLFASLVSMLVLTGILLNYFATKPSRNLAKVPMSKNQQSSEHQAISHNGILVLPFGVGALTESQQWLRYGAMEGVIKKIKPNNRMTIFHLEDVIEILNRIPDGKRNNISNIFARSGASYILETSVSGTLGELIFVYTIYSRTHRVTNTISAKNHEEGLLRIVTSLEQALDENLTYDAGEFDKQLQNDLISKAVQFLEVNDYASALTFLNGALINEPNNMTALYFLVKTKLILSKVEESLAMSNKALALIDKSADPEYKPRLLYFKGVALMAMGKSTLAEENLLSAKALARNKKDWLYYAYSQSMLGKLNLQQQHFDRAYKSFSSALEYQELLNCPLGITQGHIDFADYYLNKGEKSLAKASADKAKKLIHEKKLAQAQPLLKDLEKRISLL